MKIKILILALLLQFYSNDNIFNDIQDTLDIIQQPQKYGSEPRKTLQINPVEKTQNIQQSDPYQNGINQYTNDIDSNLLAQPIAYYQPVPQFEQIQSSTSQSVQEDIQKIKNEIESLNLEEQNRQQKEKEHFKELQDQLTTSLKEKEALDNEVKTLSQKIDDNAQENKTLSQLIKNLTQNYYEIKNKKDKLENVTDIETRKSIQEFMNLLVLKMNQISEINKELEEISQETRNQFSEEQKNQFYQKMEEMRKQIQSDYEAKFKEFKKQQASQLSLLLQDVDFFYQEQISDQNTKEKINKIMKSLNSHLSNIQHHLQESQKEIQPLEYQPPKNVDLLINKKTLQKLDQMVKKFKEKTTLKAIHDLDEQDRKLDQNETKDQPTNEIKNTSLIKEERRLSQIEKSVNFLNNQPRNLRGVLSLNNVKPSSRLSQAHLNPQNLMRMRKQVQQQFHRLVNGLQ